MYFGLFKQLRELNLPGTQDSTVYEGYFSLFYDAASMLTSYDKPLVSSIARQVQAVCPGPILELACGAGRVTLPLAEEGYDVFGLDLSRDMLKLLHRKYDRLASTTTGTIRSLRADMTDFHLNDRYSLALLLATSITLLENGEQIERMLACVYEHLMEEGVFLFDVVSSKHPNQFLSEGRTHAITAASEYNEKHFILMGEEFDPELTSGLMNFYAERIREQETSRYFGWTKKWYHSEALLEKCIHNSPFACWTKRKVIMENGEENTFYLLGKEGRGENGLNELLCPLERLK